MTCTRCGCRRPLHLEQFVPWPKDEDWVCVDCYEAERKVLRHALRDIRAVAASGGILQIQAMCEDALGKDVFGEEYAK